MFYTRKGEMENNKRRGDVGINAGQRLQDWVLGRLKTLQSHSQQSVREGQDGSVFADSLYMHDWSGRKDELNCAHGASDMAAAGMPDLFEWQQELQKLGPATDTRATFFENKDGKGKDGVEVENEILDSHGNPFSFFQPLSDAFLTL